MNPRNLKEVIALNTKLEELYTIKKDISKKRLYPYRCKNLSEKDKEIQDTLKNTNRFLLKEIMAIYKQLESL